jgi:general secretion pathway protein D
LAEEAEGREADGQVVPEIDILYNGKCWIRKMINNDSTIFRRVSLKYKKSLLFILLTLGFCFNAILLAEEEPQMSPAERTEERGFQRDSSEHFNQGERGRRSGFRRADGIRRSMRPMEHPADPNASTTDSNDPNQPAEMLEAINLNNIEMKNIIQKIADWTQKPVIPTSDEVMKARISIYSPKKVPRDEALSLIITALHAKGVVVEELEDKVFLRPLASMRLGSVPTIGVDEPLARIQVKTSIVEKWFQLKSYSPTQLIQIINPLIAEYGYAVADEGTMRIAVIDTVDNLLRIERLIQQVDIPESDEEIEQVFELKYGDPLEIVQVLQIIFDQKNKSRSRSGGGGGSGSSGQKEMKNAVSVTIGTDTTTIRLIPMTKQRWILARASREDMLKIKEWIKKLDIADNQELRQTVVQVSYANVQEVVHMVQNTIQKRLGTEVTTNIVVEALPQNSQIVIYGNEPNRKMVERLIADIDLPREDSFVDETYDLKHADPDEIKKKIDELYGENVPQSNPYYYGRFGRYGDGNQRKSEDTVKVISYPLLKQITVIASEQNLKKIAGQIKEWDNPLDIELDQYRILSLKNSDPVQLADLLKRLFSEDSGDSRNLFRMLFWGGDDSDSKQKIVGSLYGMLTFEPVPETKKLIVISKIPEAYEVIERLVERLDSQEVAEVPKVITLNYADAEDLCDQLNAILNEPGTLATLRRQVEGLSEYDPESSSSAAGINMENDAGTITPWWTRQRMDNTEMPSSNLIGQVRFVPVHRSKAVLVLSPPEYLEDITMMIKELDRPGMQVMIKVVIVDINLSDATSLGVQYASDPAAFGTLGVNAMTALNELLYTDLSGPFTFASGADISVLVDLLVKKANGRILNQPTLWTKDNEEAMFVKGQKIGFIENVQSDNSNPNSFNRSFTYEDVGVTLRIRPNITPERAVDMTINLNISQVEDELINTQIVRANLDTTTHLIVNDGQSVMLGGILERNDGKVIQKVPLLGDLPILGFLFRHEKTDLTNSELLIFMTPYVIDETTLKNIPPDEMSTEEFLQRSRMKMEDVVDRLSNSVMQLSEDPNDLL